MGFAAGTALADTLSMDSIILNNALLSPSIAARDEHQQLIQDSIKNRFTFQLNTESLGLWSNGKFEALASADYGLDFNDLINWSKDSELNARTGLDTEGNTNLERLVYQHHLWDLNTHVTIGRQDFSNSFYRLESTSGLSARHLNRAPEITAAGGLPFASSAVGIKLDYRFDQYYMRLATYDSGSASDISDLSFDDDQGLFSALESGLYAGSNLRLAAGAWAQHAPEDGSDSVEDNPSGIYFIAETHYNNRAQLFFRAGQANVGLYQTSAYRSAGAVLSELFSDQDRLGVTVAKVALGATCADRCTTPRATSWEVTYQTPSLLDTDIQATLYYQLNPNLALDQDHSKVVGFRFFKPLY